MGALQSGEVGTPSGTLFNLVIGARPRTKPIY